jgi:hypothetical protein
MNVNRKTSFQILLDEWRLLNFYGRFEAPRFPGGSDL